MYPALVLRLCSPAHNLVINCHSMEIEAVGEHVNAARVEIASLNQNIFHMKCCGGSYALRWAIKNTCLPIPNHCFLLQNSANCDITVLIKITSSLCLNRNKNYSYLQFQSGFRSDRELELSFT